MKTLLKILLIVLLTSCATLTYDYDDVYYTTEQTINFIPRIYQYYTPPLIFYWDYSYFGWQQNYYCGYYQCYSCYPYCYYPRYYWILYNPYYYWSWYNTNNYYYGRRYLPTPTPNHERQVQKITTNKRQIIPNKRTLNKKQIVPNSRYVKPRTRQIVPKQRPLTYQNIPSNKNKSHIYNRSTPQRRSNSTSKIGARTK